jgi:hypothetical protein
MSDEKYQLDERRIQEKAYELWQRRGCPSGDPDRDWHDAVAILSRASSSKVEPSSQRVITNQAAEGSGSTWSFPTRGRQ